MRHYWVDRIVELELGRRAAGIKSVALSEDVFNEHFPGNPVFPGIYLLEGLAQTAGVLLTRSAGGARIAVMVSIDRARFPSFARPGDSVRLEVEIEALEDEHARVLGTAAVEGRQVAMARFTFKLVPANRVVPEAYRAFWQRILAVWCGELPEIDG